MAAAGDVTAGANLAVAGTLTAKGDLHAEGAITLEGATADDHETTLSVVDSENCARVRS